MKYQKQIGFLVSTMILLLFTVCGNSDGNNNSNDKSINILITKEMRINIGETKTLKVTRQNTDDFIVSVNPPVGSGCVKSGINDVTCTPIATGVYFINVSATADTSIVSSAQVTVTNANDILLLHKQNMKYIGAFMLTKERIGCSSWSDCVFDYGGRPIAFDSTGNDGKGSLFIGSHIYSHKVSEVSIPNPINSTNRNDLNTADILQGFHDLTKGNWNNILENGDIYEGTVHPGGLMVHGDNLIGSVYIYYPGPTQILSHFIASKYFSKTENFSGMYKIGDSVNARVLAGYMDTIPLEWQEKLGGKAITGTGGLAIISTTSAGPSAFAFDPSDLGVKNPTPANTLMYYNLANPLAAPETTNPMFNLTTNIRGVVFPNGYDSVLFFGNHGFGEYCYGTGTSDLSLVGKFKSDSTIPRYDCYDPGDSSSGTHAYPYKYQVWAYNANDFLKVRKGELNPWEVRPYETWNFEMPFQPEKAEILGTAYDKTNRTLYISQANGDGSYPIIQVFEIAPIGTK